MKTPTRDYYVKCEDCDELIAQADNIQKLLEVLMQELAYHNTLDEDICSEAKEELSFDDARGAFAGEYWQVYESTKHEEKPVEWEEAGYGGLKNE